METNMETREQKLAEAKVQAERAKELLGHFENVRKQALAFVPGAGIFATKKQRVRSEQWDKILERLHAVLQEPYNLLRNFEYHDSAAKEKLDDAEKVERGKADAAKYAAYQQDAILWLLAKGKVLGTDFTLMNAVDKANEIAYAEEIARLQAVDEWFYFNGQNCDGPCRGWDGKEHRCDCGNRRVSWTEGFGHSFKQPHVIAEAY